MVTDENQTLSNPDNMGQCWALLLMAVRIRGLHPASYFVLTKFYSYDANRNFCYTVREITMISWINSLTDTLEWDHKIFDPDFTFKWKSDSLLTGYDTTRSMTDWVRCNIEMFHKRVVETSSALTKSLHTPTTSSKPVWSQ